MSSRRGALPDRVGPGAVGCGLPLPLTGLVGREREMARLSALIGEHRLLTLTGPGGCGKTRLALAVAGGLADRFAGGVCWVELATLSDPGLVPQAVARALGVPEQPALRWEEALCRRLGSAEVLLVLDNCEHLVEGCAVLAGELLSRCGGLRILATSRVRLGLTGEIVWPVPPLSVPDPGNPPPLRGLLGYEAVRLLVERAAAVDSTFTVDAGNAPAVARVCYRLDGMPLAIELAAARVRVYRGPAAGVVRGADGRGTDRAAATANTAGDDGLEPRAAHPAGTDPVSPAGSVCRRVHHRGRGGCLRWTFRGSPERLGRGDFAGGQVAGGGGEGAGRRPVPAAGDRPAVRAGEAARGRGGARGPGTGTPGSS